MRRGYVSICSLAMVLTLLGSGASAQTAARNPAKSPGAAPGSGDNLPHTIFVVGKVAMSDGSAVPAQVAIVSICGSNSRREALTRPDGSFSFMLGDRNSSIVQDASNSDRPVDIYSGTNSSLTSNTPSAAPPQFDTRSLQNCELRAELQGYQSSHAEFPGMPSGRIDVGTLTLTGSGSKTNAMVSVTTLQAPSNARKEFEKGKALLDKGKLDAAEASLHKAVEEYPQYAEAWCVLGSLQTMKKDAAGAHASYEAAHKADPSYPPPYLPLARAAALAHQWQDALSLSNQLIAMDASGYPMAYYYNAMANYNLNHLPEAEASALKAEGLDRAHSEPRVQVLLGMIYTARENYPAAAQHFKTYLQLVPEGPLAAQVKSDLAKCEEMAKASAPRDAQSKP